MSSSNNLLKESISIDQVLELSRRVVSRYVSRRIIPSREREDVMMAIVEKFINQQEKIQNAFEGKSKVTTYLIAVLNRMCCEIIRRDSKHWYSVADEMEAKMDDTVASSHTETEKNTLFINESKRLANAMLFFNGDRVKTRLFLRFIFGLPTSTDDIELYCKDRAEELKGVLSPKESLSKAEKYDLLAVVVNTVEGKDVKGDAVRMWLSKQMETLLYRMNGKGISNHSKDSIEVLFEMQDNG